MIEVRARAGFSMSPTYWEIRKQLEPSLAYANDVDRFMHQCEPTFDRDPIFEFEGKSLNLQWQSGEMTREVLDKLPSPDRTRAAILALSLFIDWINVQPYEWFPFYEEGDSRRQELDWVIDDLRGGSAWNPRLKRFRKQGYSGRYRATVTPFLDGVFNQVLMNRDSERIPTLIDTPEEAGFISVFDNPFIPTAQELATLGIDSLILSLRTLFGRSPVEKADWEVMAIESFAWSWQFLNQPVGGSRQAHWERRINREGVGPGVVEGLFDNNYWYFAGQEDLQDWYEDDLQQQELEELFAANGPGWYEPSSSEFIGRQLPFYMVLGEVVDRDDSAPTRVPIHYIEFWLRWFELVRCRFPIHHWEAQL